MTSYRKRHATHLWHWSSACSGWPDGDFDEQPRFPNANVDQYCKECLALTSHIDRARRAETSNF